MTLLAKTITKHWTVYSQFGKTCTKRYNNKFLNHLLLYTMLKVINNLVLQYLLFYDFFLALLS